jgi:hypothetical protein
MTPAQCCRHIDEVLTRTFPPGIIRDVGADERTDQ